MPFNLSRCISLRHPAQEHMIESYREVLGIDVSGKIGEAYELQTEPIRMFVDRAEPRELELGLLVPNLEKAREELVAAGCRVIRWEGRGKDFYIRDPFGTTYNLREEPEAFTTD